jgi:hypothetical protein
LPCDEVSLEAPDFFDDEEMAEIVGPLCLELDEDPDDDDYSTSPPSDIRASVSHPVCF